jgi:TRAP-type C4-dicarboxylate transport system permease large subunit
MILFILAGASMLSSCMAFTGIPRALAEWVAQSNFSPYALIAVLAVIYLLLGMAIDGISMIVLTTSIVLPMIDAAGFDLIWFGIFIVILVEIAQITPPVGFNLFVLQTMAKREANYVARAAIPFFFMMLLAIVVVSAFPAIATWLPDALLGVTKK